MRTPKPSARLADRLQSDHDSKYWPIYSLGPGQSKVFTVQYTAPSVPVGHTISDVRQIDLGSPCEGRGYLIVEGTAVP